MALPLSSFWIGITLHALIKRFGRPLPGDVSAAAWPRKADRGLQDMVKWERAWWFVFKKASSGRIANPKTLEYVASLKGPHAAEALMDLFP